MKKNKFILIGSVVILIGGFTLFINNSSIKEAASWLPTLIGYDIQSENGKKLQEVEEIQNLLSKEGGLFKQVNANLEEKGYAFQMLLAVYSKEEIQVKYLIENKEATKSVKEEIKLIFYESVENNKLDSNSFSLKIGNSDDRAEW